MSEAVRHALLILFIFACYALVNRIEQRVADDEAAATVQNFTVERRADELADGAPVERFAVLPLEQR